MNKHDLFRQHLAGDAVEQSAGANRYRRRSWRAFIDAVKRSHARRVARHSPETRPDRRGRRFRRNRNLPVHENRHQQGPDDCTQDSFAANHGILLSKLFDRSSFEAGCPFCVPRMVPLSTRGPPSARNFVRRTIVQLQRPSPQSELTCERLEFQIPIPSARPDFFVARASRSPADVCSCQVSRQARGGCWEAQDCGLGTTATSRLGPCRSGTRGRAPGRR